MTHSTISCPDCTQCENVIPFFYGLPTLQTLIDAKSGKIALGDSSLWPDRPTHTCKNCSSEFNEQGITGEWKNPFFGSEAESQVAA